MKTDKTFDEINILDSSAPSRVSAPRGQRDPLYVDLRGRRLTRVGGGLTFYNYTYLSQESAIEALVFMTRHHQRDGHSPIVRIRAPETS